MATSATASLALPPPMSFERLSDDDDDDADDDDKARTAAMSNETTPLGRQRDPLMDLICSWTEIEDDEGDFTFGADVSRAFVRGLVFPVALAQQLGRVPFFALLAPWALALAVPVAYVLAAPETSAIEGFGPLLCVLASSHLAALGDEYAASAVRQVRGLHAMSRITITVPGGRARRANEVAAEIRARTSRWHRDRLYSCAFAVLCLLAGVCHGLLPLVQRALLGRPLLGQEPSGGWNVFVVVGSAVSSSLLVSMVVFFGRYYLLSLQELARRWAIFAKLTPALWPPEVCADRDVNLAPPSLVENGAAWMRVRAQLRADGLESSLPAQLYFGSVVAILAVEWLYLVPRLLAKADGFALLPFGHGMEDDEAEWLSLVLLIASFDTFVAVPLIVGVFFAAYRVNEQRRAQSNILRRLGHYLRLLVAHGEATKGDTDALAASASRNSSYGTSLDAADAAPISHRAIVVYRAYADWLAAAVTVLDHESRGAVVAGVPVGYSTMRVVLVLGAVGFFAAVYYLSLNTITVTTDL